ncbi:hypothetical protein [Xanthomonas oryzae]|uniref:hypothetical protein n=1 Tax=Xanthomonas oryzae TaxID=347 RepID=UPI0012ADB8D2|nr:hypothetical protein [Xanthomonas oryzae]UWI57102.1 hypothetical protein NO430_01270 [Xanthomonas oryzae pv. oryzae]
MGHFYGNVVLPGAIDPADEVAVINFVHSILVPHQPEQDECVPFAFYSVVDKGWYSRVGDLAIDVPQALSGSKLVIIPVVALLSNDAPYVFVAPDGEWHQAGSTYTSTETDECWPKRFRSLAKPYKDHLSAVVYFKC